MQPYVGVGGAAVHYFTNTAGRRPTEPSFVAGAGVRTMLTSDWGMRLDARLRGWQFDGATGGAVNSSGEITLGLSRRW